MHRRHQAESTRSIVETGLFERLFGRSGTPASSIAGHLELALGEVGRSGLDPRDHPRAAAAIPYLAGDLLESLAREPGPAGRERFERRLVAAVCGAEPRLDPPSVRVELERVDAGGHVVVTVEGRLRGGGADARTRVQLELELAGGRWRQRPAGA